MTAISSSLCTLAAALGSYLGTVYVFLTGGITGVLYGGIGLRKALRESRDEWPRNLETRYGKRFSLEHARPTARRAGILDWIIFMGLACAQIGSVFLCKYYEDQHMDASVQGMNAAAVFSWLLLYLLPWLERRILIPTKLNSFAGWTYLRRRM